LRLKPKKTDVNCTFPAKSHLGFGGSAKKWVAEALFLSREPRTTSATFLGSISAKLPTNTYPGSSWWLASRDTWFHIPEKFPLRGRISRKKHLFRGTLWYPVCAQPTGNGKCSATPILFPSASGHPRDLSFMSDFC